MKRIGIFSLIAFIILSACSENEDVLAYIDPMIGTDETGHTFPGATLPFGMVQLSPSNDFKSWAWCSGYHYSDSILKGFAHTHISGAGLAGLGDFLFMPTSGELKCDAGSDEDPDSGYRSRFTHQREDASAGYYSVELDDYNIGVELTTTERVGFHRYTFYDGGLVNVIIDPGHHIMERIYDSGIEFLSDHELRGYKHTNGEGGERTAYFYANFSKPFKYHGCCVDGVSLEETENCSGLEAKSWVQFDTEADEDIEIKVALSFVSYDGAMKNFKAEAEGKDFDIVHEEARDAWREKVSKIEIDGATKEQKRIFYTAMYHSFISPNLICDVDGNYIVEGKLLQSDFPQYSNFSTWDTYRALHPLFEIIEQDKTRDFVNSLVSRHVEAGVGLPVWECLGHDNICMIGYNAVSPMADAALKGVEGVDAEAVYQAIKAAAFSLDKHSPNYDKNGMESYVKYAYVPGELNCAVSKTTEQNYYDWCISELAEKLGYEEDAALFRERSLGYRNLFNAETQFLSSKYSTGEWREVDPTVWDDLTGVYVSGNMWGYSSYVPHDVKGLSELIGGREAFGLWLEDIFTDTSSNKGTAHVDISGFIGKYGHGDEPSHHMPYLFNYAGKPWKTQEYVRQIMKLFYSDKPNGLVNNEDLGQMSAWYIFSALGFYPVCPGDMQYVIGSPLFGKSVLNLENGKRFTVIAKNNSEKNKYIQSATLNGEELAQTYITHQQVMEGGELVFQMGSKASDWGIEESAFPYSEVGIDSNQFSLLSEIVYSPYDPDNSIVFEKNREVSLICNTSGTKIYYTLNGDEPSEESRLYNGPIQIMNDAILKAISFKDGEESTVYEREYFKGRHFDFSEGNASLKLEKEASSYGDKSGRQLMDGVTASPHYGDGKWTGWSGEDMIAAIDLGDVIPIQEISVGYLINTNVWIFPPAAIAVYVSDDGLSYRKVAGRELGIVKDDAQGPKIVREPLLIKKVSARYMKIEVENMHEIPLWHGASGHSPWMFLDEILVN